MGKRKLTIEEMQTLAKERNGRCLSKIYIRTDSQLLWQCSESHRWLSSHDNVKAGNWCKICKHLTKAQNSLKKYKELAILNGGVCLSQTYLGIHSKLLWRCSFGHVWSTSPNTIRNGHWCGICNFERGVKIRADIRRTPISKMKELAESKKGKCLSDIYINSRTKLKWQCEKGHIWVSIPSHIKNGHWCPECAGSIFETLSRQYFEDLFGKPFPRTRPKWLINSNGNRQELDGYSPELKLAFEYNGQQHYAEVRFYNRRSLKEQQDADANKRRLCELYGVTLIEIPFTVAREDLRHFIVHEYTKVIYPGRSNLDVSTISTKEATQPAIVTQEATLPAEKIEEKHAT